MTLSRDSSVSPVPSIEAHEEDEDEDEDNVADNDERYDADNLRCVLDEIHHSEPGVIAPPMKGQAGHQNGFRSTAETLPPELMLNIFSFLSSTKDLLPCLLVCKAWARCSIEMVWFRPVVANEKNLLKLLTSVCKGDRCFPYSQLIKRLNLAHLHDNLSDTFLHKFAVCTSLERLTLTHCKKLTDTSMKTILQPNHHLLALDVTGLNELTDETLLVLAEACPNLQGLNVSLCTKITDAAIVAVGQKCTLLRRLKMHACERISDKSIARLASDAKYLLEVDLVSCALITNESVQRLMSQILCLRELRLGNCENITDGAFVRLDMQRFEHLRILDLTNCNQITDDSILKIVQAAPKIRNLVVSKCDNITDKGVLAITKLGKNLHYLHLGHCSKITDRCIIFLARYCNRIRYIDLACCNQLSDIAVHELAKLPKLRRIGLVKCINITDMSIYAMVNKKSAENSLERVHLSYCHHLSLGVSPLFLSV